MGRRAEVLFLMAGVLYLFATVANAECDCDTTLPVFSEDPLMIAGAGTIAYVTPDMVWVSDNGECAVENSEGFYEGEASNSFFFQTEEYGQIQIYANDFSIWQWVTMDGLNEWALQVCDGLKLIS